VTASKNSKPSRTFDRLSDLFECRLKPAFDFPIDLFFSSALARAFETSLKTMTKPSTRARIAVEIRPEP
jgi:hypothetical protein